MNLFSGVANVLFLLCYLIFLCIRFMYVFVYWEFICLLTAIFLDKDTKEEDVIVTLRPCPKNVALSFHS